MTLPWLLVPAARAHTVGLSSARLEAAHLVLTFAESEIADLGPEALWAATSLRAGGIDCLGGRPAVRRVEADGLEVRIPHTCTDGPWTYEAGHLARVAEGHRQYVEAFGAPVGMLTRADPVVTVTAEGVAAEGSVAARFFGLGVEHIVTGWDHLAFLFGLLLVARSFRDMAGVITGFTLAHSVTLSAATLGWVTAPAGLVEPLIALSIAAVGVENLFDPPPRRRFVLTCALGLIHGFGFAGMLAGLGLPVDAAALALACFNLGVEVGQVAIVAPILPVLLALRARPAWLSRGVPIASVVLALAGLYGFAARAL